MIVYKTRWFDRWANKQGLTSINLCTAVREMTRGLYDVDLGNGLLKKRIARSGQGKRSGFRTLVATNKGNRWIFLFGFPKNERSNIDKDEEVALKLLAAHLLSLTAQALDQAQHAGELMEVNCDAQD
ncbi:MAG TPA: type II toxin-antitoxin system RelE/ParE family toxin [Nitrosomonas sp.]|nr:type II toxin-antitoxin system RelE/ParE family toxin [Nitrosomonas sp.]HNA71619.1 type II toxin-antitoxin system RelE/ParE family toxin [Nitrosomonas sp.]HNJ38614.1 type II toxin-antitoxin system RelE/ParE family toxin [Nitrosomonas sp.]HNK88885.1 type II toxin-antitoxin system RelE/ParE family toxin [Nitrosomonas sp.]HNM73655.1 type II toxin-antitoxin system RelE/ParE family toxin [Nitrosomonas sp.]